MRTDDLREEGAGGWVHVCLCPGQYLWGWGEGRNVLGRKGTTIVKPRMPYFSIRVLARGAWVFSM